MTEFVRVLKCLAAGVVAVSGMVAIMFVGHEWPYQAGVVGVALVAAAVFHMDGWFAPKKVDPK